MKRKHKIYYRLIFSCIIKATGLFFCFLFLAVPQAIAQDIHFAQFMYSPLNLNPANAGFFDGDYRFAFNHREQWNAVTVPYKTFSGSFDMNLEKLSNVQNQINAGILFNSDKAGDGDFGTMDAGLTLSALHFFGADSQHTVGGGIQAGFVQRSITYNKLTFDNQFNGDVFDPSIDPGEDFQVSRFYYFNFSAGVAWKYQISKLYSFGLGVSLQHLNKPRQSFFDDKVVRLPMRLQVNFTSELMIANRLFFLPDVIWMKQNTFSELTGGGQVKFRLSEKPGKQYSIYFGIAGRLKDALIPMVGFDYNALHFGVSYDINTSGLKRASNREGGLELALIYIIKKIKRTGIKPPCVIY